MEFANKGCRVEDRRIIISSKKDYIKLVQNKIGKTYLKSLIPIVGYKHVFDNIKNGMNIITGKNIVPYPIFDISEVKNYFNFPPQHPIVNTAYATCDVTPNVYIPLSEFHYYFLETKHSSLRKLCADLGAKDMYLEYTEVNKETWKFDVAGNNIPTNLGKVDLGLNLNQNREKNMNGILAFTFPPKNKEIKKYSSPWLETEPTWKNMVDLRKENYLDSIKIDFNYTEDYGINGNLTGALNGIGVNIGGEFKKFNEIRLKYNVTFWE